MAPTRPLPRTGSIFVDTRGGDRALRVSWHHEAQLVVLSLWRDNVCAGSFRMDAHEVPGLIEVLAAGLARGAGQSSGPPGAPEPGEAGVASRHDAVG